MRPEEPRHRLVRPRRGHALGRALSQSFCLNKVLVELPDGGRPPRPAPDLEARLGHRVRKLPDIGRPDRKRIPAQAQPLQELLKIVQISPDRERAAVQGRQLARPFVQQGRERSVRSLAGFPANFGDETDLHSA